MQAHKAVSPSAESKASIHAFLASFATTRWLIMFRSPSGHGGSGTTEEGQTQSQANISFAAFLLLVSRSQEHAQLYSSLHMSGT